MEIGPIPGVRVLPTIKAPPNEADLITAAFDIEAAASLGQDSYRGGGKKTAGSVSEPDEQDPDTEVQTAPSNDPADIAPAHKIDYFA